MTFPNVKNDAGKHKSTKISVFEGVAGLWPATLFTKKNTDFFVLFCLPASFLTLGAPNSFLSAPGPPQTDFFFGGGGRGSNHKPTKAQRCTPRLKPTLTSQLALLCPASEDGRFRPYFGPGLLSGTRTIASPQTIDPIDPQPRQQKHQSGPSVWSNQLGIGALLLASGC